jgi:hypothetical protein
VHGNKKIANTCTTKLLGLTPENTLSWKKHTDTMVPKLSSATIKIRTVPGLTKDDILLILSLYNDIRINFGGKFTL